MTGQNLGIFAAPSHFITNKRLLFIAIVAFGLFSMATRPATDPDLGWHLKTGQIIAQTHHIFHSDPYSFTRAGQPWINHEWLSDLLMYGLYRLGGSAALIILFAAVSAAAFLVVFLRGPGKPYLAGAVTIWGALASGPSWGVRPQIFSLLLASIFLWILERSENEVTLLWWTLPLTVLWVNLHAEFALGIALIALFFIGTALDWIFGFRPWAEAASSLRNLALALGFCLALVPLNPYGTKMYLYPWHTLSSTAMAAYIQEWMSPDFHKMMYLPFLLMVLALLAAAATSRLRLRPRDILLVSVMLFAGLRSVRHIPIFAIVAAPILGRLVQSLLEQRNIHLSDRTPAANGKVTVNAAIFAGFVIFVALWVRSVIQREPRAEAENFPAQAISFLAQHQLPGPLFNHYNWGGYLIWKLYPRYEVFADGRADVYGDQFLDDLAEIYFVRDHWRQKFEAWPIRTVIVPPNAPLIAALRLQSGWKQVYADQQAIILERQE